jgi:hypothetical protein
MPDTEPSGLLTFPCHLDIPLSLGSISLNWIHCPDCGSMVRQSARQGLPNYDDQYPNQRGHYDPLVGEGKKRSLQRWLSELSIRPENEVICEVGFGAGWGLQMLHEQGAYVMGLEPIAANREHAEKLGIPAGGLFDVDPLPSLPRKPSLWLFLDSFEHVPDPSTLLVWLGQESSPTKAMVLLVSPDAGSLSRRIMGPLWPFHGPDHWVHYTLKGVKGLFGRQGFHMIRKFEPTKFLPMDLVIQYVRLAHPRLKFIIPQWFPQWRFWIRMGQMGLVFQHNESSN